MRNGQQKLREKVRKKRDLKTVLRMRNFVLLRENEDEEDCLRTLNLSKIQKTRCNATGFSFLQINNVPGIRETITTLLRHTVL